MNKKIIFGILFGKWSKSRVFNSKYNYYIQRKYSEEEAREKAIWHTKNE